MIPNRYKIGYTYGDRQSLINRYITAIPDLVIHSLTEYSDVREVESQIHSELCQFRMKNMNDRDSEWFLCSLETIEDKLKTVQSKKIQKVDILSQKEDENYDADRRIKINCWRELIKIGNISGIQVKTLIFSSQCLYSREFSFLMEQIENAWRIKLVGKKIWKNLGSWLREHMFIPDVLYSETKIDKDTNIHTYTFSGNNIRY